MLVKFHWILVIIFIGSLFFLHRVQAQTTDVSWVSAKLNAPLNQSWTLAFRPIQRTQLNTTDYLNTSIDVSATRKLTKQFSAQLLVRQFLVPGTPPDRTFFWTNLIHSLQLKPITIKNTIRHHWGLNIYQEEADFFRWIPQIAYQFNPQIKLFIQSDVFFQFNKINGVKRMRYQAGIHSKVSKTWAFNVQYWRQNSVKIEPSKNSNIYVLNLIYTIDKNAQ